MEEHEFRFYLSCDIKITLKSHFCHKNGIILSLCTQRCYERHNVVMDVITFPQNLSKPSGLSILLHSVFSFPDPASYDNCPNQHGMIHHNELLYLKLCTLHLKTYHLV